MYAEQGNRLPDDAAAETENCGRSSRSDIQVLALPRKGGRLMIHTANFARLPSGETSSFRMVGVSYSYEGSQHRMSQKGPRVPVLFDNGSGGAALPSLLPQRLTKSRLVSRSSESLEYESRRPRRIKTISGDS